MKKLKMTLILLCTCCSGLLAQSTLNAAGGGATIGGNSYDYSVGEMAVVSTASTATLVVTQGLLQPQPATPDATSNLIISENQLSIYPNPTTAILNLQPQFTTGGILSIQLVDMNGRMIQKKEIKLANGSETQKLDISSYATGNYLLNVQFENHRNTYKIQKIK